MYTQMRTRRFVSTNQPTLLCYKFRKEKCEKSQHSCSKIYPYWILKLVN